MKKIAIALFVLFSSGAISAQKVGVNNSNPQYDLDVKGFSASSNQVTVIPLWQNGASYVMLNISGADLNNCESAIDPTIFSADGNIEVRLVIRIQSTSANINNFQLRAHNGVTESYPIINSDAWVYYTTQTGYVAISPWKLWAAGTVPQEVHLYGWVDTGSTNFVSAYLMVRPRRS